MHQSRACFAQEVLLTCDLCWRACAGDIIQWGAGVVIVSVHERKRVVTSSVTCSEMGSASLADGSYSDTSLGGDLTVAMPAYYTAPSNTCQSGYIEASDGTLDWGTNYLTSMRVPILLPHAQEGEGGNITKLLKASCSDSNTDVVHETIGQTRSGAQMDSKSIFYFDRTATCPFRLLTAPGAPSMEAGLGIEAGSGLAANEENEILRYGAILRVRRFGCEEYLVSSLPRYAHGGDASARRKRDCFPSAFDLTTPFRHHCRVRLRRAQTVADNFGPVPRFDAKTSSCRVKDETGTLDEALWVLAPAKKQPNGARICIDDKVRWDRRRLTLNPGGGSIDIDHAVDSPRRYA